MPASQEQKVDFLLKKIGYSASKTGIAEDESTIGLSTNTAKAPFEEGIASPLVIPQSSILADSGYIPTTPPGSDTAYVKGYRTATALRMTRDSTVGTNTRSYIAYTTYNDTSSARLTNWIDTQFGASYIIKVFKGDPNSGGVELQQAGANAGTDGWFFDYSSGILNFNGVNLPSGISATNIYIVGYRYIGATGIRPPAGIGTFESLHVSGIATFKDDVEFHGVSGITSVSFDKSDNSFKFVDGAKLKIGTGLTVSSNGTSIEYFNNSNIFHNIENSGQKESWLSRVSGVLVPQFRINHNSGVEAFHANGGIKFSTTGYGVTVFGTTETQKLNVTGISTVVGVGTFKDDVYIDKKLYVAGIEIGGPGGPGIGTDITTRNLKVTGIATVTGNTDLNGNLDVAGTSVFNDDVTFTGASGNILFDKTQDRLEFDNNIAAAFGDGRNLRIFANNSNGQINNYTGDLYIQNDSSSTNEKIYIRAKGAEDSITATANSSVDLAYDGTKRFSTSGVGATVFGELDVTGPADIEGNLTVGVGGTTITTVVGAAASVGIGDASPSYMLDVAGAINSQTDVKINGVSVTEQALNDAVAMAIALG